MNLRSKSQKDGKFLWTNHSLQKMAFYRLSESKVKRVLRHPARVEEGIAPNTAASMQPSGSKKRLEEIWVMWQKQAQRVERKGQSGIAPYKKHNKITIISAWRYPGASPVGKKIPIPDNIWEELIRENLIR